MMARDRSYQELLEALRGKKVAIWTCNTCARLCNGVGGHEAASRLAEALRKDGVEVAGVMYTSASCLQDKVRAKEDPAVLNGADLIVSLTCDLGSVCAAEVFGKEVLNPIVTFGPGIVREDGSILLCRASNGRPECESVSVAAAKAGLDPGPFA
ncbi:MAG: hypothetical protein LBS92_06370 [Candidatus Methanoplasma sp.]|nr:hypothetical protein [Candidatus Methanoplasma sp.]